MEKQKVLSPEVLQKLQDLREQYEAARIKHHRRFQCENETALLVIRDTVNYMCDMNKMNGQLNADYIQYIDDVFDILLGNET